MEEPNKFKKRRHDLEEIPNIAQRNVANVLYYYMQQMNITMKDFSNIPPVISIDTLVNIGKPKYNRVPSVNTLRCLAKKIETVLKIDANTVFKQFLQAANYDINLKLDKRNVYKLDINTKEYDYSIEELLRAKTTIEQIFKAAKVQNGALAWNSEDIENILKMAYPNMYIKVLNSK